MDNTKELLGVLSLCSGYGGLELGLERVFGEVRVLAHVEIEAFAIANLVNKMETGRMVPAPIWTDLKTLPLEPFRGKVGVLTGGYPCQPFSAAGKRKGSDDPRHLWPYIERIIDGCEPEMCFFENVEGHISLGLCEVLASLESRGYETTWGIFSAAEVGAPHQRKRVFILAHRISEGPQGHAGDEQGAGWQGAWKSRSVTESSLPLGYPESSEERRLPEQTSDRERIPNRRPSTRWPSRPGEEQYEWEEPRVVCDAESLRQQESGQVEGCSPEPPDGRPVKQTQPQLGRTPDGARDRVDRLRLLGNGVVPQTAEKAFRTLLRRLEELYKCSPK